MKYKYTSFFPPDRTLKWIKRPMILIEVFGPNGSNKFSALIDSGADCSLFNVEIAEMLDLDLSKGRSVDFAGISGKITGYRLENIQIKIEDFDKPIKIPVCFVRSKTVGLLLGEEGFFDKYRIKFEKDHDAFEIKPGKK